MKQVTQYVLLAGTTPSIENVDAPAAGYAAESRRTENVFVNHKGSTRQNGNINMSNIH